MLWGVLCHANPSVKDGHNLYICTFSMGMVQVVMYQVNGKKSLIGLSATL